ncbi:helix-turn-helix domain-containing protein [Palleniella intestinalis]|uniref:helix-turn-helix domain-containing protein n=1 Tax=Palleniella intestinalis TaxID=2736291 RepID=UPI0020A68F85|nr:helix-turn-helix transcriptional regulator [Palleniella intestinalis]
MPAQFPHFFILRPLGAGRLIANTMHVGKLIEQELKRQQRSQAWLARALNCSPANVCKIISRQYIDTDTLARICKALNHNFFDDLAKSL